MKSLLILMTFLVLTVACNEENGSTQPGTTNLAPQMQEVSSGAVSSTGIATLAKQELSGKKDEFDKYIEYNPASQSLEVVYTFRVAATAVNNTTDFRLVINYRGPEASADQWAFELQRPGSTAWEQVGNNNAAQDWKWTFISFNLGKMNSVFTTEGVAKVRVRTLTGKDSINLDLFALNYGGTVATPTPTVTATPSPTPTATPGPGTWWKPAPGLKWDIQYVDSLNVKPEIQVYNIDAFDTPATVVASLKAQGKKVICYFSGGSSENWRPDFSQFPSSVKGKKLDGWDGENWLDVRQISILKPIMAARIQMAKDKGCDAVDPDNMDGYTNSSGFPLTYAHQLAYNKMIAEEAHVRGLAVGLKNDLDQINDLVDFFDFSVNESCFDYDECHLLSPFITKGKPVFGIQYNKDVNVFCPQAKAFGFDFIKKKWDLDAWIDPCWNHKPE